MLSVCLLRNPFTIVYCFVVEVQLKCFSLFFAGLRVCSFAILVSLQSLPSLTWLLTLFSNKTPFSYIVLSFAFYPCCFGLSLICLCFYYVPAEPVYRVPGQGVRRSPSGKHSNIMNSNPPLYLKGSVCNQCSQES